MARAQAVLPLAWFSFVAVMATAAGFVAAGYLGASPALALLLGAAFAAAAAGLFYLVWYPLVIGGTVRLFGRIYGGPGGDWRPERTYWRAQALAGRGAVAEAVEAYEDAAGRHPDDPIPCLRAAALCAGELNDPESAVGWYLRARATGTLDADRDAYVSRRLAELYEAWPGHEKRALVELRRLLTLYPESAHAAGARARLETLKARLVREDPPP